MHFKPQFTNFIQFGIVFPRSKKKEKHQYFSKRWGQVLPPLVNGMWILSLWPDSDKSYRRKCDKTITKDDTIIFKRCTFKPLEIDDLNLISKEI